MREYYFKINSLWKREGWYFDEKKKKDPKYQQGRQSFIVGDYACPTFANVNKWQVSEKIDGTSIVVGLEPGATCNTFSGRTKNSIIPPHLLEVLEEMFDPALFNFNERLQGVSIRLFGEGFGPKIQKAGALYAGEHSFVLFDVLIGRKWCRRETVDEIGESLNIFAVPDLGIMSTAEVVEYVRGQPLSVFSKEPQVMEGVVCRPHPMMLYQDGKPITMKLKTKEFK